VLRVILVWGVLFDDTNVACFFRSTVFLFRKPLFPPCAGEPVRAKQVLPLESPVLVECGSLFAFFSRLAVASASTYFRLSYRIEFSELCTAAPCHDVFPQAFLSGRSALPPPF